MTLIALWQTKTGFVVGKVVNGVYMVVGCSLFLEVHAVKILGKLNITWKWDFRALSEKF